MSLYPIFLKLQDRKVLVVGGGKVAEEKIFTLLRSANDVTVIAPRINNRIHGWIEEGRVRHIAGEYRSGMAGDYFLVITCTDSAEVNRKIYQEAQQAGVLCNAVDDPGYCDFYSPAVVSRGEFQIAISTGGNSPALAQRVRKKLEQEFGPEYEFLTGWLGRMREGIMKALPQNGTRKELLHLLAHQEFRRVNHDA
jgi:precorrin-2 dehydrogenase